MINFCPTCGEKTNYQHHPPDTIKRATCSSCHQIHYENPRIITGILPIYNNQIILCKRAIEPQKGKWTIPAGFMEQNETVEEGALREAKEEANIDATIDYLLNIESIKKVNQVYIIFKATVTKNTFKPMEETEAIKCVDIKNIPWNDIAFSAVTASLKKYSQKN